MAYTSWANHLKSAAHINAQASQQRNQILAQETHQQYQQLYSSHSVPLRNPPPSVAVSHAQRDYFAPLSGEDINGILPTDFEFDEIEREAYFVVGADGNDSADDNILRHEVELLHLEALEEEFEGADDETIPALAEEFRDLGKHILVICIVTGVDF